SAHEQAARVLVDLGPRPDRLIGIMLKEHADARSAALGEAVAERAGHNYVATQVLAVKTTRVAFENAIQGHVLETHRGKLHLSHRFLQPSTSCFHPTVLS